ncbi:MAG: hypothetical protein GX573_10090, partial [Chloroflexi bacterium]|nr:hypothetical protein [Chloroflexota bacterium]
MRSARAWWGGRARWQWVLIVACLVAVAGGVALERWLFAGLPRLEALE